MKIVNIDSETIKQTYFTVTLILKKKSFKLSFKFRDGEAEKDFRKVATDNAEYFKLYTEEERKRHFEKIVAEIERPYVLKKVTKTLTFKPDYRDIQ